MRSIHSSEDGFSIMESMMAMVIVVILFVSTAVSLQVSMRHQRNVRLQQQASALVIQELEVLRALSYEEIQLTSFPSASAPFVSGTQLDGTELGLAADEPFLVDATDGVVITESLNFETYDLQEYDVYRYVSEPQAELRRIVVVVQWAANNQTHTEVASTLLHENGSIG